MHEYEAKLHNLAIYTNFCCGSNCFFFFPYAAGTAFQEVLHCQWCVELWSCDVWDMGPGTQTVWGIHKSRSESSLTVYMYDAHQGKNDVLHLQTIKAIDQGIRLHPPPGCPVMIYELMIQCWWVGGDQLGVDSAFENDLIFIYNLGILRPHIDLHSLNCYKFFPLPSLSFLAGLRRTWGSIHKLQYWGLPWRLPKISTLNCRGHTFMFKSSR